MPQASHLLATDPRARTNLSLRLVRRLPVASASADALVEAYLATDTPVVLTGLLGAAPADERLARLLSLARRIPRVAHGSSTVRAESLEAIQARPDKVTHSGPTLSTVAQHGLF